MKAFELRAFDGPAADPGTPGRLARVDGASENLESGLPVGMCVEGQPSDDAVLEIGQSIELALTLRRS